MKRIILGMVIMGLGSIAFAASTYTCDTSNTKTGSTTCSATTKTRTKRQIKKHNTKKSCYTIINNSVYDLTSFIKKHPGGEKEILKLCGKDGTKVFMGQHGNSKKNMARLESFKIGVIK